MALEKEKKEIPPLRELVNSSFRDVEPYNDSLNFPEILIIGSLSDSSRTNDELRLFGELARQKLHEVEETHRKNILDDLITGLYKDANLIPHAITNYSGKYSFLVSDHVLREGLKINGLEESIKKYKRLLNAENMQNTVLSPEELANLDNLRKTHVNLTYHSHPLGQILMEPYMIISKTKAFERIAGKIPYAIISKYREREGAIIAGNDFINYMSLKDGIIKDYVGLQVIVNDINGLADVKSYFYQSNDIEVLVDDSNGSLFMDYYAANTGPYKAIHFYARHNPDRSNSVLFTGPGVDQIEVILIDIVPFLGANFGRENYWDRINSQRLGIVGKQIDRATGGLKVEPFTESESLWKLGVEKNIIMMLEYDSKLN